MTPCSHVLSESNLNVDHPHLTKPLSCLLVLYVWPQSKHINLGIKIQNVLYSFSTNLCIFVYFMYLLPRWYQKSTLLILVYIEGLDINVIYCCRDHKAILSSFAIYVTVIKLWNSGDFFFALILLSSMIKLICVLYYTYVQKMGFVHFYHKWYGFIKDISNDEN